MLAVLSLVAGLALQQFSTGPYDVITWRTYKDGAYSKAVNQAIVEMNTLGEYQKYVNQYEPAGVGDGRDIDWNKEEVVAVHSGERRTGGYRVVVESIAKINPREARLSFTERTPIKGVATTDAITSPFMLVRLNRFGGKLVFSGSKREDSLPGGIKIITSGGGCGCCNRCGILLPSLAFDVFDSGSASSPVTPINYTMSSHADFDYYRRNFGMSNLSDDNVNWMRERLVAIHFGKKIPGIVDYFVDRVRVKGNEAQVSVYEVLPNGIPARGITTGAYTILRLPRIGAVVTVQKKQILDGFQSLPTSCDCGCAKCKLCNGDR